MVEYQKVEDVIDDEVGILGLRHPASSEVEFMRVYLSYLQSLTHDDFYHWTQSE
jgi:hypothetical protein